MLQGQMTYTCPRGTVYGHHTFLYKCGAQLTFLFEDACKN